MGAQSIRSFSSLLSQSSEQDSVASQAHNAQLDGPRVQVHLPLIVIERPDGNDFESDSEESMDIVFDHDSQRYQSTRNSSRKFSQKIEEVTNQSQVHRNTSNAFGSEYLMKQSLEFANNQYKRLEPRRFAYLSTSLFRSTNIVIIP